MNLKSCNFFLLTNHLKFDENFVSFLLHVTKETKSKNDNVERPIWKILLPWIKSWHCSENKTKCNNQRREIKWYAIRYPKVVIE
ncbi:hypothetical protein DERF_004594 [Dermatophagoides farinae]|uniref:Uncharacterized protein n=1 Tax=Dermatophagoides farinae TaxID=6954 RepID=A0A922L5P8_DERFA|nr:hypothetical protein DERF_004594 [Dermatophagoides farinae]